MRHSITSALFVFLVGGTALAATPKHETFVNGSFGSSLDVSISNPGTPDGAYLNVGHLFALGNFFQVGGVLGAGTSVSGFLNAELVANLNFEMNEKHTLIVGGSAGWKDITRGARQFNWRAFVGTRCKIVDHLYWRPTVGVKDEGGGIGFRAELLSLSLTY